MAYFPVDFKQSVFTNILIYLSSFIVFFGKCSDGQFATEVFKCWFGEPVVGVSECRRSGCPDSYICVKRFSFYTQPNYWEGCCPRGNGPCHEDTQVADPSYMDYAPPKCTEGGMYEPLQCHFAGCFCALPDGTPIEGTLYHKESRTRVNCTSIVSQYQMEQSGDLPVIQPMVEELSLHDLGMRRLGRSSPLN